MRTIRKWVLVLAVAVLCVAAAQTQERLVPEGTTLELILLRQKSVQEELKLSPEITKKVMEFTNKQHDALWEAVKGGKDERKQRIREMGKENRQFLSENLAPEQRKRLTQITLQLTGLIELTRPRAAKELNLTQEQQDKFRDLQKDHRRELVEIILPKGREGRSEKLAKLREDTRNKIRAILTDEQKAKVKELVGEPFTGKIAFEEDESKDKPGK